MVRLKYVGNGDFIMMIPNRDLTDFDIETITARDDIYKDELIARLLKSKLYQLANVFYCSHADCENVFKTEKALIKHELKHVEKEVKEAFQVEEENDNA